MLKLALAVIAIALPDCINPSLIGGELFVATGSHPRRRTAAFALAAWVVTFVFGLALALGLGDLILSFLPTPGVTVKYALITAAGLVLVVGGTVVWIRRQALASSEPASDRRRSHRSSGLIGAGIAGLELLTAFPYFAAIAMIVGSGVSNAGERSLTSDLGGSSTGSGVSPADRNQTTRACSFDELPRPESPPMSGPLPPRGAEDDARRLGWALFPVRLFLGVTFVYGGVQKLSDPGFLHAGAPTFIGTQLRGFANGTPGGFLLRAFAIPHPALAGVAVALTEIAVGLLVATGLVTRAAATVGLLLNLLLFLTNSWRTYPYFLGSDIVFVFAWLPFVVAGAAQQPTLESIVRRFAMSRAPAQRRVPDAAASTAARRSAPAEDPELTRRGVVTAALSAVAAATAFIAGISLLLRGAYRPAHTLSASASRRSSATAGPTPPTPPTSRHRSTAGLPAGAVRLGAASQLPAGQGATYRDPGNGQPDIVIRQTNGTLVAHSAVCTHAGCEVGYQGGQIVCPCHGSIFDAKTGAVISGPAVTGLAPRKVIQHAGEIYALRA